MNILPGSFDLNALSSAELNALANTFTPLPPVTDNTPPAMIGSDELLNLGVSTVGVKKPAVATSRVATNNKSATTTTLGVTGGKPRKPRQRDMEKNRLAAKACRERKKAEFETLKAQVSTLAESNEQLLREIAELRAKNAALVGQLEAGGVKVGAGEAKYTTMYMGGEIGGHGNAPAMEMAGGLKMEDAGTGRSLEEELAALTSGLVGIDEGVPDGQFYDGLF